MRKFKIKKPTYYYVLTIVSTCSAGQDIHSYIYPKKTQAQADMKLWYKADKNEIDPKVRVSHIDKDGYEIYEKGNFCENHLTATIRKSEIKETHTW